MGEVLNSIYDNAVADMENAFGKLLDGGRKMNIDTDKKMQSVFGEIELLEIIPNEDYISVTFLDEEGDFCEEKLTDFSIQDIIGIGEFVDDYGKRI